MTSTAQAVAPPLVPETWEARNAAGPGLVIVVDAAMVSPTAKPDLTDDLWQALLLMRTHPSPDPAHIAAVIARAEAHMGTTDYHRIEALERAGLISRSDAEDRREMIRGRVLAAKRRAKLHEHRHAAQLGTPTRDPAIVAEIANKERQAHDKRAEAASLRIIGPKIHRKAAKALESQARALDEQAAELKAKEAEQDRLYGEAKDPILRAKMRGEEIAAADVEMAEILTDEYGARIIERRGPRRGLPAMKYTRGTRAKKFTGIEHAHQAGHLRAIRGALAEDHLLRIAALYGSAYEIVEGMASHSGEGGGGFKPKAPLPRSIEAGEALADMRRGLSQRQRDVLDLVCGEGLRAREAADKLHAGFPATIRALVGGLKAAEANRLAERERREHNGDRPVGAHVQAVNAMLRGVRA